MKTFVTQSALRSLFSHLERHPSAELTKVAYETELGVEALIKRLRTLCNQAIGTSRKMPKHVSLSSLATDI